MYVIMKGNYFVSLPGSKKSYTTNLQLAQTFSTKEDAEKNRCGNERVVNVYDCLRAG